MSKQFKVPLVLCLAACLLLTLHTPVPTQALTPANSTITPISTPDAPTVPKIDPTDTTTALYIVQLAGEPLAAYAVIPKLDGRPNLASSTARIHAATLARARQNALGAIQRVVGHAVAPLYVYDTAFNGMAIELTGQQAAQLTSLPGIVSVQREQVYEMTTDAGPAWIGADTIWDASVTGVYAATILGANEAPAVSSQATGRGTFTFTPSDNTLNYTIVVGGFSEAITGAHIHRGSPGNNGPVVVELTPSGTPGTYAGSTVLSAADAALLESDGLYVNFHTATNPGGEIRGNISGYKGEGVVAGILDSGINTTHPSFAAVGGDGYRHLNPRGEGNYRGACDPNNLPSVAGGNPSGYNPAVQCNSKLIGAWTFTQTSTVGSPAGEPSPNDDDGHGSHTASTVVGNVQTNIALNDVPFPRISGVAPHANVIAYDVCGYLVGGQPSASCPNAALTAAVDQAIRDQVDVINYSISGGTAPWTDAVEVGFRNARAAGIVVLASAGNSGPTASTVAHVSPWLLSVAATTHNRRLSVALTNLSASGGATLPDIAGLGTTRALPTSTPLIYAGGAVGNALCGPFTAAQAAQVAGRIVLCDRGTYGRVEKAQNVQAAGGVGYVLANDAPNGASLSGDVFPIPGIHISYADGVALKNWLTANPSATARITATTLDTATANGDVVAAFSSRGPATGTAVNVLKPDVGAPGVDILAAVANNGDATPDFDIISGTSMAAPHTTGAAALLVGLHPDWTPGQVQSALATTALGPIRKEDGSTPTTPFDVGTGRIRLERAALAGLVLDETIANFISANPTTGGDPRTLNIPSMVNTGCVFSCSWTRTVKSTLPVPVTWTGSGNSSRVSVSPASFTIQPGGSQTITISFNTAGLPNSQYSFGRAILTAQGGLAPDAAFSIAAIPGTTTVPTGLRMTAFSGVANANLPVSTQPYTALTSVEYGLIKGTVSNFTLAQGSANANISSVTVPANSARIVAQIRATTSRDADIYVYRDNGNGVFNSTTDTLICSGTTTAAVEYCNVNSPTAGLHFLRVVNFTASATPPDAVTLVYGVVPRQDVGNFAVTGPTSHSGGAFNLNFAVNEPSSQINDIWYGWFELTDGPGGTNLGRGTFDFLHVLGPPGVLDVTGGTPQSAVVDTNFATPLALRVTDVAGNPVPGATVSWSAPLSGPSATFPVSSTTVTDPSGVVSAPVRANTVAGTYSVTATVQGANGPITANFSLTNTAGAPTEASATGGTSQSAPVSQPFAEPLDVTIVDAFDNPVPGADVTFSAPGDGPSASFSGGGTATSGADGVASITATANTIVGSYTVTATVDGIATPIVFDLTNLSGTPANLETSGGTPQTTVVNTDFTEPLAVEVTDESGNIISNVRVTFSAPASGASATFPISNTAVTDDAGVAAVTVRANTVAGSYSVVATVEGHHGPITANFNLTNRAGAAASLAASGGASQSTPRGQPFAQPLAVTVVDQYNNAVAGVTVTFAVPASGASATLSSPTATTDAQGRASVTATANATTGSYDVIATTPGVAAVSFRLTNLAAVPASVTVSSGSGQSASVNQAFAQPLQVTVTDAGGAPLSGVVVTFSAPTSGASASFPSGATATTNAQGRASLTVRANGTVGSYSVTARVAGVNTPASFSLTNTASAPARIVATGGVTQTATLGTAFAQPLQVRVTDSSGNPLAGVTVTFTAPSSGARATLSSTTATTNASGQASVTATAAGAAGSYTVTATVAGVSTPARFSLTNRSAATVVRVYLPVMRK